MQRLFWAQNENPNTPNTLINDRGSVFLMGQQENKAQDLFDSLLNHQNISKKRYQEGNLLIKKHPKGGFFISSNFIERDEANRQMGFMFFTPNTGRDEVIADLYFFSDIINRSLTETDKTTIYNELNVKSPFISKGIIALIAVAVSIIIIYILWKKLN